MLIPLVLSVLTLSGCATAGGRTSAADCTAIAIRAASGQATLTEVPAPCRRLGPVRLSQTVKIAVYDVTRNGSKSQRRHLAIQAYRRLAVITAAAGRKAAAQRAAAARRRAAHPASGRRTATAPRLRVPAGIAALVAWLLTAGAGGVLVLRRRGRRPLRRLVRSLPPVLIAHLSFALTGLVVWVAYLLTDWTALAWAALAVLLPVAGLGMATLLLAIPVASDEPRPETVAPSPGSAAASAGGPVTATSSALTESASRRRPGRPPVLLIAAHGTLATITILLALLGAVAAVAAH